jgi:hypothetical protein
MATKELGPDGVEIWRSNGGELSQWSPVPGVMCVRYLGDIAEDLAPPVIAFVKQVAAQGPPLVTFIDAEQMTNYDTLFRVRVTHAYQQLGERVLAVHMLARSMLLLTAMRAASFVLQSIISHASRRPFEAALAKIIAERILPR